MTEPYALCPEYSLSMADRGELQTVDSEEAVRQEATIRSIEVFDEPDFWRIFA